MSMNPTQDMRSWLEKRVEALTGIQPDAQHLDDPSDLAGTPGQASDDSLSELVGDSPGGPRLSPVLMGVPGATRESVSMTFPDTERTEFLDRVSEDRRGHGGLEMVEDDAKNGGDQRDAGNQDDDDDIEMTSSNDEMNHEELIRLIHRVCKTKHFDFAAVYQVIMDFEPSKRITALFELVLKNSDDDRRSGAGPSNSVQHDRDRRGADSGSTIGVSGATFSGPVNNSQFVGSNQSAMQFSGGGNMTFFGDQHFGKR